MDTSLIATGRRSRTDSTSSYASTSSTLAPGADAGGDNTGPPSEPQSSPPGSKFINTRPSGLPKQSETNPAPPDKTANSGVSPSLQPNQPGLSHPVLTRRPVADNSSDAFKRWASETGVVTENLLMVDGLPSRNGLIKLGEHAFIVGPTPSKEEDASQVLPNLVQQHPELGLVVSVHPDKRERDAKAAVLKKASKTPVAEPEVNKAGYRLHRVYTRTEVGAVSKASASGEVEHKAFTGFTGRGNIKSHTLLEAGKELASFMKTNPEKQVVILSEQGVSRPCAVAAITSMLLDPKKISDLSPEAWQSYQREVKDAVVVQRSPLAASKIEESESAFAECREFIGFLEHIRSNALSPKESQRLMRVASGLDVMRGRALVIQNEQGAVSHYYAKAGEAYGDTAVALAGQTVPKGQESVYLRRTGDVYQACGPDGTVPQPGQPLLAALYLASTGAPEHMQQLNAFSKHVQDFSGRIADNMYRDAKNYIKEPSQPRLLKAPTPELLPRPEPTAPQIKHEDQDPWRQPQDPWRQTGDAKPVEPSAPEAAMPPPASDSQEPVAMAMLHDASTGAIAKKLTITQKVKKLFRASRPAEVESTVCAAPEKSGAAPVSGGGTAVEASSSRVRQPSIFRGKKKKEFLPSS